MSQSSNSSCNRTRCEPRKVYKPCCCRCPRRLDPYALCKKNLFDIADSIIKILEVFGLEQKKATSARKLIFLVFHHYDYVRFSYTKEEPVHLTKDLICNILYDMHNMTRIEAELTYYCIKRAFKAYFHNKCKNGLNNPILDAEITAQDSGAWRHAARTTARIFEKYENIFPYVKNHYEQEIRRIYMALCSRMQQRTDPLLVKACPCEGCAAVKAAGRPEYNKLAATNVNKWAIFGINSRNCKGQTIPPYRTCVGKNVKKSVNTEDADCLKNKKVVAEPSKLEYCYKCKIIKLLCDCEDMAGRVAQGPYETYWNRVHDDECDKHYVPPGHLFKDPINHHCPIDCAELSFLTDDSDEETVDSEDIDEDSYTDAENENFVQPGCCCQQKDDLGI